MPDEKRARQLRNKMQAIACDGKRESGERPACGDSGHEPQRKMTVTRDGKRLCGARGCASAGMATSRIYKKTPARVQRGRGRGYLAAQFAAVTSSAAATAPAAAMISAASGEVA